ncbi:MAG: hypothetical protein ACKOEG_07025, partial [Chthoniobacterales bacterium]
MAQKVSLFQPLSLSLVADRLPSCSVNFDRAYIARDHLSLLGHGSARQGEHRGGNNGENRESHRLIISWLAGFGNPSKANRAKPGKTLFPKRGAHNLIRGGLQNAQLGLCPI